MTFPSSSPGFEVRIIRCDPPPCHDAREAIHAHFMRARITVLLNAARRVPASPAAAPR
ncbi:hypothetical protein ABT024_05420 [Streptomyces sp. NPDC002812]|uniref:hypothetical protein n=1 Tax=Streptomyces sp. NPDC002812 TaxID=3154434 RepID=UPI00332CB661